MNLLLLLPADEAGESRYKITGARLTHIINVLQLSAGGTLEIGLLNGPIGTATIERITEDEAIIRIADLHEPPVVPLDIDLILGIPRPKTLRKVLVTCAMMGVRSLHLVRANRTEKSYLTSPILQPESYESYLFDGLSQGKLTRLPRVTVHPLFRPFVEDTLPILRSDSTLRNDSMGEALSAASLPGVPLKLLCDIHTDSRLNDVIPTAMPRAIMNMPRDIMPMPRHIMLAIGPEGDWVDFERDLLHLAGFMSFTLGPWTLRVETAVAAALAQLELLRAMREM